MWNTNFAQTMAVVIPGCDVVSCVKYCRRGINKKLNHTKMLIPSDLTCERKIVGEIGPDAHTT